MRGASFGGLVAMRNGGVGKWGPEVRPGVARQIWPELASHSSEFDENRCDLRWFDAAATNFEIYGNPSSQPETRQFPNDPLCGLLFLPPPPLDRMRTLYRVGPQQVPKPEV